MRSFLRPSLAFAILAVLFPSVLCLSQDIEVSDFVFVDEQHGWVLSFDTAPVIFRTVDGGATWTRLPVPVKDGFYRLHFLDARIGVALHYESETVQSVYRTTDAGDTWSQVASLETQNGVTLMNLAATSTNDVLLTGQGSRGSGYVAQLLGKNGTLRVRGDLPVDISTESPGFSGIFGDGTGHFWIVGKEMILHSPNRGETWEKQTASADHWIDSGVSGLALPGGHAWAVVANYELYRTVDYGKHWVRTNTTVDKADVNFESVSFVTPEKGCALGSSPFIYCTRDGGLTWSKTKVFPHYMADSTRAKLYLFSSLHGWASMNGALYQTLDGGQSFHEVLTNSAPPAGDLPGETQAVRTSINGPTELAYDKASFLYIVERVQGRVLRLNLAHSSIKAVVEVPDDEEGDFSEPNAVAADQRGHVFIADFNGRLRKLDTYSGEISTLLPPEGDHAAQSLDLPESMTTDHQGNPLIVDRQHKLFRWRSRLEVVAGGFSFPSGVAVNAAGDIFIADYQNCRIRKIDHKTQAITTVAGTGECNYGGEGRPAAAATVNYPGSMVADDDGNLFFLEGARVRRIDKHGVITTYAGTDQKGYSGDGGPAAEATLNNPSGLALDEAGNLYVADYVNNCIRRVDAKSHVITTVAGNGKPERVDVIL